MWKIALATLATLCNANPNVQIYAKTMQITALETETDLVVCTDFTGYEWSFYGCEDWEVGDVMSCIMSDNGTEIIWDDQILSAKYECFDIHYPMDITPFTVPLTEELTSYNDELIS